MSIIFKSEDDRRLLIDTIDADKDSVHFFWNCRESRVAQLCGNVIPEDVDDPFAYLNDKKYVKGTALAAFGMFCAKIKSFIGKGTEESRVTADFSMLFSEEENYRLCQVIVILLKDSDRLLKYLKDSLSVICSDEQPFARMTADVFMIVIPFGEESEIIDFIHNLEDNIGRSYEGIEFRLVFGVCIVEDRTVPTRTSGDSATLARQSIKGNALNNIGFYNGKLKNDLYHQHYIEDDMTSAMLNNEFVMFLQPKYNISSGEIIGAEALARWMDDFGTGFSSLNMLKTTPFDVLKIDRIFLSEFMESERGRKIIAHTISMSRDIGLNIIAEGVETGAQAQFLKSCGCDIAQGFYYMKPVPVEEFDKQLKEKSARRKG